MVSSPMAAAATASATGGATDTKDAEVLGMYAVRRAPEPPSIDTGDEPIETLQHVDKSIIALFDVVRNFPKKYKHNNFNDLGKRIPRDETREANTTKKIIAMMNEYEYGDSVPGVLCGVLSTVATLGFYWWNKRVVVPPSYFGHYRSSGRDFFVGPGRYTLISSTDVWVDRGVPIDDEARLKREYGSKTLLYVPENHVAGAFRVGIEDDLAEDGDYVIFPQGHHVLPNDNYRSIAVVRLGSASIVTLGPMTILFVKEGHIAGAYSRQQAQFHVFYPGPPYILNNKDYEGHQVVRRTLDTFRLGPITFVTVQENQLACAVHIQSGKTQYMSPGKTYQLHDKDYSDIEVIGRTSKFSLGCCHFLTVEEGFLAGALNKRTGRFEMFSPGKSYRLPMEVYDAPVTKQLDSHIVRCGHVTAVTPQDDLLIGAYRKVDGEFITVTEPGLLHQKDYYDVQVIKRFADAPQNFGPYIVITIKGGTAGVFNKSGTLEVKEAGWYKLPAEYDFEGSLPLNTFSSPVVVNFTSKDGVNMKVSVTASWMVNSALDAAVYPGGFAGIQRDIPGRCMLIGSKLCRKYNRDQILPTRQDVVLKTSSSGGADADPAEVEEMLAASDRKTMALHADLENSFREELIASLDTLACGVEVKSCRMENFVLLDEGILLNLRQITQALAETNRQKVEAERELKEAQNKAQIAREKARADAAVSIERARAEAEVRKERERAEAELTAEKARADAEIKKAQATAHSEVEIKVARAKAEARRIEIEIENEALMAAANTEAAAIKARADAENTKRTKELEAYDAMTEKQLKLELADRQVEMARHFGQAAWLHPDRLMRVLKDYDADIRIGPDLLSVLAKGREGGPASSSGGAGRKAP